MPISPARLERARRRREGLCTTCGKNKPKRGHRKCKACLEVMRAWNAAQPVKKQELMPEGEDIHTHLWCANRPICCAGSRHTTIDIDAVTCDKCYAIWINPKPIHYGFRWHKKIGRYTNRLGLAVYTEPHVRPWADRWIAGIDDHEIYHGRLRDCLTICNNLQHAYRTRPALLSDFGTTPSLQQPAAQSQDVVAEQSVAESCDATNHVVMSLPPEQKVVGSIPAARTSDNQGVTNGNTTEN